MTPAYLKPTLAPNSSIRREETAGSIEIIGGKARRRSRGQVDYTLRVKVASDAQPVAIAPIEAKKEHLPPGHGLDQGKAYAHSKQLNVPFVFSSNGHQFVEYDRFTGQTSPPKPMAEFPAPHSLRRKSSTPIRAASSLARPLSRCSRPTTWLSVWMVRVAGWITCSSNACGVV